MDIHATKKTYWLAFDEAGLTSGEVDAGAHLSAGRDFFETFTDLRTFRTRLRVIQADLPGAVRAAREALPPVDPFERLASVRWQREIGGITLPDGTFVRTDRESQSLLTGALQGLASGMIAAPISFKFTTGWVDLTAEQLTGLGAAVSAHVQACFAAERAVYDVLAAEPNPATVDIEADFAVAYQVVTKG